MAKILIADDEPALRMLLAEILDDAGCEVIEAADGGEAFELACSESPDLIFLDVRMPVLDGIQVLQRLRERPERRIRRR